jgi:hypothetical protein
LNLRFFCIFKILKSKFAKDEKTEHRRQQKRRTMDDGRRAGLVSKETMREEMAKRAEAEKREREREERQVWR